MGSNLSYVPRLSRLAVSELAISDVSVFFFRLAMNNPARLRRGRHQCSKSRYSQWLEAVEL